MNVGGFMRLMDKSVKHLVIRVTPEMRERIKELNKSVIDDSNKIRYIRYKANRMQSLSMQEATKLDNESLYGSNVFPYERGYTKKKRFK